MLRGVAKYFGISSLCPLITTSTPIHRNIIYTKPSTESLRLTRRLKLTLFYVKITIKTYLHIIYSRKALIYAIKA